MSVRWQMVFCAVIALAVTALSQQPSVDNVVASITVPKVPNVQVPITTSDGVKSAVAKQGADPKKPWTLIVDNDQKHSVEKMKALCSAVIDGKSKVFTVLPTFCATETGSYYLAHIAVPGKDEEFILRVSVDERNHPYQFFISSGSRGVPLAERLEVRDASLRGLSVSARLPAEITDTKGAYLDVPAMLKEYLRSCICACHEVLVAADNADKKRQ